MCLLPQLDLLFKATVASCSFCIKLFNVSALLLDDALSKCLFSIVAFKTLTFHKVVLVSSDTLKGVVGF